VADSTDVFNIITSANTLATYTPVPNGKTLVKSSYFKTSALQTTDTGRTNNLP